MVEYSVQVKPQNRNAVYLCLGVTVLAAVAFYISTRLEVYRGIFQFLALLLLTTTVLIYTQYVTAVYLFDVFETDDGTPLFTVRRLIGKRTTTLARFSLYEIFNVQKTQPKDRMKNKREKGRFKYVYAASLFADALYRIQIDGTEKADVYIELNEEGEKNLLPILEGFQNKPKKDEI